MLTCTKHCGGFCRISLKLLKQGRWIAHTHTSWVEVCCHIGGKLGDIDCLAGSHLKPKFSIASAEVGCGFRWFVFGIRHEN